MLLPGPGTEVGGRRVHPPPEPPPASPAAPHTGNPPPAPRPKAPGLNSPSGGWGLGRLKSRRRWMVGGSEAVLWEVPPPSVTRARMTGLPFLSAQIRIRQPAFVSPQAGRQPPPGGLTLGLSLGSHPERETEPLLPLPGWTEAGTAPGSGQGSCHHSGMFWGNQ